MVYELLAVAFRELVGGAITAPTIPETADSSPAENNKYIAHKEGLSLRFTFRV